MTYQEQAIINESEQLNYLNEQEEVNMNTVENNKLLLHLSISQILSNISTTIIVVISELLDPKIHKSLENIFEIFFKDDRMIYLGLTLIIISVAVYLVDSTR